LGAPPSQSAYGIFAGGLAAADRIGPVKVDMDGTACKVPNAAEYIEKVRKRGSIGKKRKTVKC
jgi:hypothetical protein